MEDVVKTFIIKYGLIEQYFDSAKYKKFIEDEHTDHTDTMYKSMKIIESIDSYPYFIFEVDYINNLGKEEYYEFKVLFNPQIEIFAYSLLTCIMINKPKRFTLKGFIDEIDKRIAENRCNWNVYASK